MGGGGGCGKGEEDAGEGGCGRGEEDVGVESISGRRWEDEEEVKARGERMVEMGGEMRWRRWREWEGGAGKMKQHEMCM